MSKNSAPPPYSPPPSAPPSYAQAVGGVPPTSPFVPQHTFTKGGPTILTTVVPVGPDATHMICPHCRAEIDTCTYKRPGGMAYLAAALICLVGCAFGCCLIPFCLDTFMDIHHVCPNCKAYLGRYRK